MEHESHRGDEDRESNTHQQLSLLVELLPQLPPYDFTRRGLAMDGVHRAELEERHIDDRTARNIALLLGKPDDALAKFAGTGEVTEDVTSTLAALDEQQLASQPRDWKSWLEHYCHNRFGRGAVEGWSERLDAIDRAQHAEQTRHAEHRYVETLRAERRLTYEISTARERGLELDDDAVLEAMQSLCRRRRLWRDHFYQWIATGEATPHLREELARLHASDDPEVRLRVEAVDDWSASKLGQRLLPEEEDRS